MLAENKLDGLSAAIAAALEDETLHDALSLSRYGEGTANTIFQIYRQLCAR